MNPMNRLKTISAAVWASVSIIIAALPATAADDASVSVRVMERSLAGDVTVTVTAPTPFAVSWEGGSAERDGVTVAADGSAALSLRFDGTTVRVPAPVTIAPLSVGTPLTVTAGGDRHRYRGTLSLRAEGGVLVLIDTVGLEDYLLSVVPAELTTTEPAALEAQAILCRTFALKNRGRHGGWDLCDLTHCQHYSGVDAETASGTRAVRETEGLVVTYGGAPAEVFYHSSSGGMTTSAAFVWGGPPVPYLVPVRDALNGRELSAASPDYRWSFVVAKASLLAALTEAMGAPVTGISVTERDPSGRAERVMLAGAGRRLMGEEFRIVVCRRFGWGSLKSTLFELAEKEGSYRFDGRGLGHGVGMSQWGAVELARMGKDFREIIAFYFPGAKVGPAPR
jgi:stage II sporulation protein D